MGTVTGAHDTRPLRRKAMLLDLIFAFLYYSLALAHVASAIMHGG